MSPKKGLGFTKYQLVARISGVTQEQVLQHYKQTLVLITAGLIILFMIFHWVILTLK
jgi:hypothetical protein